MEASFVHNQTFHSFILDEKDLIHSTNGDARTIELLANLSLSDSLLLIDAITQIGGEKIEIINGEKGSMIDKLLTAKHQTIGFSGSTLVMKMGTILLQKGYGYSDLEQKIPNTPDTTFRLASLSKAFTSFALMRLVDQNKIALNQTLEKIFPSYCLLNPEWKKITIEMLANHTSGICDFPDFISSVSTPILFDHHSTDHLLHLIARQKLLFEPGKFYYYSNPGYLILGKIIQEIENDSFNNSLKRLIFDPLGLKATKAPEEAHLDTPDAHGYFSNNQKACPIHVTTRIGAGNLISNLSDLRIWMQEWQNPNHLHPDLLEKILRPNPVDTHIKKNQKEFYTFGWKHRTIAGNHVMYHSGNMQGCHTLILFFPKDETLIILLSNKDLETENLIDIGKAIFAKIS